MSAVMTSLSIPSFGTKYSFVRTEAAARLLSRSLSVSLLDILYIRWKMDVGGKKGSPKTGKRCKASTPRQPWEKKGYGVVARYRGAAENGQKAGRDAKVVPVRWGGCENK
jgi:hypothetical protein